MSRRSKCLPKHVHLRTHLSRSMWSSNYSAMWAHHSSKTTQEWLQASVLDTTKWCYSKKESRNHSAEGHLYNDPGEHHTGDHTCISCNRHKTEESSIAWCSNMQAAVHDPQAQLRANICFHAAVHTAQFSSLLYVSCMALDTTLKATPPPAVLLKLRHEFIKRNLSHMALLYNRIGCLPTKNNLKSNSSLSPRTQQFANSSSDSSAQEAAEAAKLGAILAC